MERTNTIRLRLSDIELAALKTYAESRSLTMSEVLRDYIKTLIPETDGKQR